MPGEICQDPSYDEDFATDLYYACIDGGDDYYPDMAHGRISVSTAAEADIVVDKIINYEKTPPTEASYYQNALNCAQFQDKVDKDDTPDGYAARRFCHTSEEIRDYLIDHQGYTVERIYYTDAENNPTNYNNGGFSDGQAIPDELLRANGFAWDGDADDITAAFDAGKFMIFHRDHGYVGGHGWAHPYYTTYTMESMNNGNKLPVIFSMNCHTGEFQLTNCFAEKLLRMENKGAVGVVGAAYYSYSGYNDAISEGMIDAIWSDPGLSPDFGSYGSGNSYTIGAGNEIYTMGDVVNQGLNAMVQNYDDNLYSYRLFHYFGDPAMKIWTADPNSNAITATHNSEINCTSNTFSITGSTPNAIATLVINNNLLSSVVLDASGNGTLTYAINEQASAVTLTISKHNQKPYIADISVIGECKYTPSVETYSVSDLTFNSVELYGEIISNNGEGITESGFVYGTTENPLIGGTGVEKLILNPLVTEGQFSKSLSSLNVSTKYYYKAYATSANGTGYGNELNYRTLCQPPSTQPSGFSVDNAEDNSLTISWNSGGDHVLVIAKEGESVNEDPIGEVTYAANPDFAIGEDILNDNIAVYAGLEESVTVTNLKSGTIYYFSIYKYSDADKCYNVVSPETGYAMTTGYCVASSENGLVFLKSVSFGSISNMNTDDSGYSDYTDISTNLTQNTTYTLTIENGYVDSGDDLAVWIDFNDNDSFDDAGENIICQIDSWTDNSFDLVIPADVPVGSHTMRIRTMYFAGDCSSSCGYTSYGEVEDYTVNIVAGQAYSVTFNITNEAGNPVDGALVNLAGYGNLTTNSSGQVQFTNVVSESDISYTVSLEGYNTNSGTITVADQDVSKSVELSLVKYNVNFTVSDAEGYINGASVQLIGYGTQESNTLGEVIFTDVVPESDISYTVSMEGYNSSNGTISVIDQDIDKAVKLSKLQYDVTITITDDNNTTIQGAAVDLDDEVKTTGSNGEVSYSKAEGSYDYTVDASGYDQETGTLVVESSSVSKTIVLSKVTSTDGVADDLLKVYPNPTEGKLRIEGEVLQGSEVSIVDFEGKVRLAKKSIGLDMELDLSSLPDGIYLLKIKQGTALYKRNIVKQ